MSTKATPRKSVNEHFARFYETPTREGLRELLEHHYGEFAYCDFKKEWPTWAKTARHILAFANSGGGALVMGIAEKNASFEPVGLDNPIDKAKIINGIKPFLPATLMDGIEVLDFNYQASEYGSLVGKTFQCLLVFDFPEHLPFLSMSEGDGVKAATIYVRRLSASEPANHDELQKVLNRRVETNYSSKTEMELQVHLAQLKTLFANVERFHLRIKKPTQFGTAMMGLARLGEAVFGEHETSPNPEYPIEDFEAFVVRMIALKKRRIAAELGL